MPRNVPDLFQFLFFLLIVTLLVKPFGGYMERVLSGKRIAFDRWCLPVEKLFYRITRVDRHREMKFAEYATSFVLFGLVNTLLLYAVLKLQQQLGGGERGA